VEEGQVHAGTGVGEDFDGLITSVTKFGFFVELTDLFVEGLVPLHSDRRLLYVPRKHAADHRVSARGGLTVWAEDSVLVDRIDPVEKKMSDSRFWRSDLPRYASGKKAKAKVMSIWNGGSNAADRLVFDVLIFGNRCSGTACSSHSVAGESRPFLQVSFL